MEIFEHEDHKAFTQNLRKVQYYNFKSNEWYNDVIDWLAAKSYKEAAYIVDLLNDFYITGATQ